MLYSPTILLATVTIFLVTRQGFAHQPDSIRLNQGSTDHSGSGAFTSVSTDQSEYASGREGAHLSGSFMVPNASSSFERAAEGSLDGKQVRTKRKYKPYAPRKPLSYYRDVALRLRNKSTEELSREEKKQLSETRRYLRKRITNYGKSEETHHLKLEAQELLGGLQGGHWKYYHGRVGEREQKLKSDAERVNRSRAKKALYERLKVHGIPQPKSKPGRKPKVPDHLLSEKDLKAREYKRKYDEKMNSKRREQRIAAKKLSQLKATVVGPLGEGLEPKWGAKGPRK